MAYVPAKELSAAEDQMACEREYDEDTDAAYALFEAKAQDPDAWAIEHGVHATHVSAYSRYQVKFRQLPF